MNMKLTILMKRAVAAACVGFFSFAMPVFADDEAAAPAEGGEEAKPESNADENAAPKEQKDDKFFFPLVRCDEVRDAAVEVLKPGAGSWELAVVKKFYPLGSAFRVTPAQNASPKVTVAFGPNSFITVTNAAEFATRPIAIGDEARFVELRSGFLLASLPRALKDGLFNIAAPYFVCSNLAGDSQIEYNKLADGDEAVVHVVTGSLAVKGSHFLIPRMGAANRVRIRTTKDELFSSIRGESGDCLVKLDQGLFSQKDYETGETKEIPKTLDFTLSPLCAIKIHRAISPVGGRRVVSMMTFAPNGEMKNRCAFAENRSNVNSGELVVTTTAIKDADRKASDREAEATESVDVAGGDESAKPAAGADDAKDESNQDEKKKDDSDDI